MGFGRLLQVLLITFAVLVLALMLVNRVVFYFEGGGSSFDEDAPMSDSVPEAPEG